MKPHTPEQIAGLESFVQYQDCQLQTYQLGQLSVAYFVADIPEENRPFPIAVAAAYSDMQASSSDNDDKEGIVVVSSDVPEDFRGLWALHEHLDFSEHGHGSSTRCLDSEVKIFTELTSLQPKLAEPFMRLRFDFFSNLKPHLEQQIETEGQASQYDAYDIDGCQKVIDYYRSRSIIPRIHP